MTEKDAILAALVKPLVWVAKNDWHHVADNPFGECWIKHYNGAMGLWTLYGPGHYGPNNNFPTLAAAQAAAEADYRARIAAALNMDAVAELVEALDMAKAHMIVNDLSLPNVFAIIDAALSRFRVQP